MTGRTVAEGPKQEFCQFPNCIATTGFQRTTLAETTLLCWYTRMTVSHVVAVKGGDQEWSAEQLTRDILKLGLHCDLMLRSDHKPVIVDLLKQVARLRGVGRIFLEQSPVGDSRANGVAERAVQPVEKMVRVHKLAFENRIGARLPVKQSDILNRLLVDRDGKTAVQRMKGRSCEQHVLEFGSTVMFRVCGRVEGACMSEKWHSGFWLGKRLVSEEHVVVKEDGAVVRARAVCELEGSVTPGI